MVEVDYPERWLSFFPRLLGLLPQGTGATDLFLRVLVALHEEVLSAESGARQPERLPIVSRIKDAMRTHSIGHVVEALRNIMVRAPESEEALALANRALHVSKFYVPWMDVSLMANDRFMPLFLEFTAVPALHDEACAVLTELVVKGMAPAAKVAHLTQLSLTPTLTQLCETQRQGGASSVSLALARLCAALATELLECVDNMPADEASAREEAALRLDAVVPLVLAALESEYLQTSSTALPFVSAYLQHLRRASSAPASAMAHVRRLVLSVTRRLCYPPDYDFDDPDEAEDDFQAYRRDLATIFKAAARADREGTLRFTCDALVAVADRPPADTPFAHAEVVLFLLYHLGEGLPEAAFRMEDSLFCRMLVVTVTSSLSAFPHRAVQLLFFENLVRYVRFFVVQPAYIGGALEALCDGRGLHNSDSEVRGRVCYLLLRFVKAMYQGQPPTGAPEGAQSSREALLPYMETILTAMQAHLIAAPAAECKRDDLAPQANGARPRATAPSAGVGPGPVSESEQVHLFEVAGLLLGGALATEALRGRLVVAILGPLTQRLASLQEQGQRLRTSGSAPAEAGVDLADGDGGRSEAEVTAAAAAHVICALGTFTKGFSSTTADQVAPLLEGALGQALGCVATFPWATDVRARSLMLLHRMVECLGQRVLAFLETAVARLLTNAEPREVQEVVTLVNQVVAKFKDAALQEVAVLVPVVRALARTPCRSPPPNYIPAPSEASVPTLPAPASPPMAHWPIPCPAQVTRTLFDAIGPDLPRAAPPASPVSEEARERALMLRFYYGFIHGIVHNGLAAALLADVNAGSLRDILRLVLEVRCAAAHTSPCVVRLGVNTAAAPAWCCRV